MTERADAVVIGAGHNGLVCAAYLARAGLDVLVLEASDRVGGMSTPRVLRDAYHFPGLAHAAYPISRAIRADLRLDQSAYDPGRPVDTVALDAGGAGLTIAGDRVSGTLSESDRAAFARIKSEYLGFARSLRPLFDNKPPRLKNMGFRDKTTLAKLGWNLRIGLGREEMYEFLRVVAINIYDVLNETIDDERLKGAIAADAVLGNAMGPRTPGTVLTWLQRLHAELNGPLSIQTGGSSSLVPALGRALEDAGGRIRCDAHVAKILLQNDRACGVELDNGETVQSGLVVSNADARSTFSRLVGAPRLDAMFASRVGQIRGAGVVAKLHLALSGLPEFTGVPEKDLGNRLLIAPSMRYVERAFNASKYRECSENPVLEVTIPSLHDSTLAPQGHHAMSVNVAFVPYQIEGGWNAQQPRIRDRVIAQLARFAPELPSLIVDQELLTPLDIERQTLITGGHWHHGELSIHQSFMMRPLYGAAQYDTPVPQLFLCGAACHPGGGLTGLPGRNAAKRILELGGMP